MGHPFILSKAMLQARGVFGIVRHGEFWTLIAPVWLSGRKFYRLTAWSPLRKRLGLDVAGDTYVSADHGLQHVFTVARAGLA